MQTENRRPILARVFDRVGRKLRRRMGLAEVGGRLDCAEQLTITHLEPVKPVHDGNAINKAGRLVLRGRRGALRVKVYEAASPEHAEFIRYVSGAPEFADHLPPVLACSERFVVARWIEGGTLDGRAYRRKKLAGVLGELAAFQARLHTTAAGTLPRADFDYWHELVRPRFSRACAMMGADPLFREASALVDSHWRVEPAVLMHPDLRPANLVWTSPGNWFLIDNELLTTGGMPMIDLQITLQSLPAQFREAYLARYAQAIGDFELSPARERALNALWLAREVSRCFAAGNVAGARDLLSTYRAGQALLSLGLRGHRGRTTGAAWSQPAEEGPARGRSVEARPEQVPNVP